MSELDDYWSLAEVCATSIIVTWRSAPCHRAARSGHVAVLLRKARFGKPEVVWLLASAAHLVRSTAELFCDRVGAKSDEKDGKEDGKLHGGPSLSGEELRR